MFNLVRILQVACQSRGAWKMDETVTSELHKKRNKILGKYAEHSFSAALDEINETLEQEKTILKSLRYYLLRVGF